MDYEDFILQIVPDGDGFTARVVRSPDGEASAPFRPPFAGRWRHGRSASVGDDAFPRGAGGAGRHAVPDEPEAEAWDDPGTVGRRLFDALFHGPVRSRFDRSWGKLQEDARRGLRIKLELDPTDPRIHSLADLPWELLHAGADAGFLSLSRRTPVVRYLEVPRAPYHGPLPRPFRILAVAARPRGTVELDLEGEASRLASACPPGRVEVEVLHRAGVRDLRRKLLEGSDRSLPYHAIHFMGHGDVDEGTGEGFLLFEDASGGAVRVTGETLATLLRDLQDLRFVLLNACQSGRAPRGSGPFAGVAASLVRSGVPAVLAMQLPIRDRDALVLAVELYDRLAQGDPVDAALAEARLSLFDLDPRGTGWATPVLFMRTGDGTLFAPGGRATGAAGPGSWPLERLASRSGRELPPVLEVEGTDGDPWVLAAHVGPSLVIGRCHDSQLRPEAVQRLRRGGEDSVHWVVSWDDPSIPQLIARLTWSGDAGDGSFLVENLTDYSARPADLAIAVGAFAVPPLPPGERRWLPGFDGRELSVSIAGEVAHEVVRLGAGTELDELPLLRTRGVEFDVPPRHPDARRVRFLGLWLPTTMESLRDRLESLAAPVAVPLADEIPGAELRLGLAGHRPVLSLRPPGLVKVRSARPRAATAPA